MSERSYQYLVGVLVVIVLIGVFWPSKPKEKYNVNITTLETAADGLDLQAVGGLVKKAQTAEHLERLLNGKQEGVNNLDLDEDGNVDYIKVTEYGDDGIKGFSLTAEPKQGEEQEIATIEIEKGNENTANVQVHGNRQLYGDNYYYRSHFPIGSFLLWSYLLRPHPFYVSPWGFGSYPSYYSPYGTTTTSAYRNRTKSMVTGANMQRTTTPAIKSDIKSPNSGKVAPSIRAPLKNPTQSQKSFQARNPSKHVRSGGFGRKSSSGVQRSGQRPSVRRSSYRRGGGSFGGK